MSEGTHSASTTPQPGKTAAPRTPRSKPKFAVLAGTAVVAVLVAVALMQVLRTADDGVAAENPAGAETAGSVRLNNQNQQAVARVNGELITRDSVADECLARHGREVLDNLINRLIIQQACQKQGIQVTAQEVDAEIVNIAKRFNLTRDNWLQMLQTERGIAPGQYQRDIIWPMLALRKLAGSDVKLTEADMQTAFERDYGARVEARMIMLDNDRRAREVLETAMKSPEEFGRLARQHSIEPNSRALDGDIPPIRRHTGNKKLEDAAFSLKVGEISALIQVGFNRWVILKCEGHTEPIVQDIEQVRDTLYETLVEEKTQAAVAKVFEELKQSASINNYITNTRQEGVKQTSGSVAGRAVAPAASSSYPASAVPAGQTRAVPQTRSARQPVPRTRTR